MPILRGLIPPLLGKALLVGALIIVLLVPIAQVDDLVSERVGMRENAAARVAESWGGPQTTAGVLLAIPVDKTRVIYGSRTETERRTVYVLPDTLKVDARSEPSYRTVGLYRTPVYLAHVALSGEFAGRDFAQWFEQKEGRTVRWDEARLLVLNSEASALRAVDDLRVAGEDTAVSAGGYAGFAGISTPVPGSAAARRGQCSVSCHADARRQPPAEFPAAGAQGGYRAHVHLGASEVRRRAGAAVPDHRQAGVQGPLVRARDQSQFRAELDRRTGAQRPASCSGPCSKAASA